MSLACSEKELEQLKRDVAKWQSSPDGFTSPILTPNIMAAGSRSLNEMGSTPGDESDKASLDRIPPLDALSQSTGAQARAPDAASELRVRPL